MMEKVATVLFVVFQCFFIACALIVAVESCLATTTLVGAATVVVVFYTLGSASRKIFDVWLACCRRTPGKGMMDL